MHAIPTLILRQRFWRGVDIVCKAVNNSPCTSKSVLCRWREIRSPRELRAVFDVHIPSQRDSRRSMSSRWRATRGCPWGKGSRSTGSRATAGRSPPGRSAAAPLSRTAPGSLQIILTQINFRFAFTLDFASLVFAQDLCTLRDKSTTQFPQIY